MTVQAGPYRLVPGDPWRTQALALLPLIDEWTLEAPSPPTTARSLTPAVGAHVTRGTLVFTGLPERACPDIALSPVTFSARLTRPGRPDESIAVTIPAGAQLPHRAPPAAVASVTIAVTGRVTAAAFPHGPVPGANLTFTGDVIALSVPLSAHHPAAAAVRGRTLVAGAGTTLASAATGGTSTLEPVSTAGVAPGDVLLTASGEFVVVDGASAVLTLRAPLHASVPAGSGLTRMTPTGIGATTTLARAAIPGDGLLPTTGPLTSPVVEIVDGARTEYRATGLIADPDGRWRLSGVRGAPDLRITTSAAGFITDGPRTHPLAPIEPYFITTALGT